jgi:hypothetical protein
MQKRYVAGRITAIQEERFRLATNDGRSFLLTLDRKSPVQLPVMRLLQKSHIPVRVEYSGEPNTDSGIAHIVQPLEQQSPQFPDTNEQREHDR